MSDDRIYVRFKGKTLGPLTDTKVRELIRRGQITRMHELSSDGLAWQRAEAFGDIFQKRNQDQPQAVATVPATTSSAPSRGTSTPQNATAQPSSTTSAPIPGQMPEDGVQWYAHVNGDNQGPINSQTLVQWISTGDVHRDTLVWRAGYDDWRPASVCMPERFAPTTAAVTEPDGNSVAQSVSSGGTTSSVPADVCEQFLRHRPWVLMLSIFTLVGSGFAVLYFVTAMVVGADAKWFPRGGSYSVIYGLSGLVNCGVFIAGAILLLNYATSLKTLNRQRNMVHLGLAIQKLYTFWRYSATVFIVFLVLFVGTAVLILVMAAAASNAVN
ncbi:hypothetical protein Pla52o_06320 [Novipirellula galeiformis]|uniref:GYF domain-containing protein n=1 Tax=Novipirellula galeiformis TaxID=2528004 RepID=A0A5C6CTB4_9BACT|nr:DUF4339 domain-containing protein [Novipirellula galeiformis]TWU26777.1 hypothetical protein Pla52o_06320 [Novipirellula galeiformis]